MNHFKIHYSYFCFIAFLSLIISCDDTTDTLGSSLTDSSDMINIETAEFSVATNSVAAKNVVSRTRTGYLGKIKDDETDGYVTCNYMTQFRTMGNFQFPSIDTVYIDPAKYDASIEKYKQIEADSCALILYINNVIGDSLALMKVSANEMSVPYEESQVYTTDFNPEEHNMIRKDEGSVHSQMAYTTSNRVYTDAQRNSSSFSNRISISLNEPYTDKYGNTYNNYGTYLLRNFYDSKYKDCYNNEYKFTHEICPGFYVKHQGGLGNVAQINISQIIVYFRGVINKDSIIVLNSSFAGTEEVMQKTNVSQNEEKLTELVNDNSCTHLKTPAGIFTEITLPVNSIMEGHENDTINTARLFIPRINNSEYNSYSLSAPTTLLLLPTDSVTSFFEQKKIADYRTSYIAKYSSSTNGYTFGNISLLVSNLYAIKKNKEEKGEALSPNWNKVTIVPVEASYSTVSTTSSVLTKVTHDMSFASTKLKKGLEDTKDIKISVIYSKFKD